MAARKPPEPTEQPRATLTPKQRIAVELLASGVTVTATADHPTVNVNRGTIREWRALPHFRAALDAAIEDIASEARDRTKAALGDVVATWHEILMDERADRRDRIRAGEALADRGGLAPTKGVELTGANGAPVQVDVRATLLQAARSLTDAELGLTDETP